MKSELYNVKLDYVDYLEENLGSNQLISWGLG